MKKVSIVIPAYNEGENVLVIIQKLEEVFEKIPYQYEIILIDDGSKDNTLEVIKTAAEQNKHIFYIEFSRNFGKDLALKAGFDYSTGHCVVSIDSDMQHPPEMIPLMLSKWEDGFEVIYAYRDKNNPHASLLSRLYSKLFYKIINSLSEINLEDGIADFRLIDRKVVNTLHTITEFELFLRGMLKWVGFRQIGIPYTPGERYSGVTTYSRKLLLKIALRGISSFTTKPLYTAIYLGFLFSFCSIAYVPYVLYSYFAEIEVSGWASTIMTIVFFGGLQLIILGIIGIYIGKMFMQTKNRPNYIIRSTNK